MGFLFWGRKKKDDEKHKELHSAIDSMKTEFGKAGEWIKHLHARDGHHEESLDMVDARLASLESEVNEIKEMLSFFGPNLFKHQRTPVEDVFKQTPVQRVQTRVRTHFKGEFLGNLTTMERAIIWVLLNTELKLSYEDIAAILGKSRATIRGQMNSIKQKSEGLIEEIMEKTGKKRVYIPEPVKESMAKAMKVTEKQEKRGKKAKKFA